MRHLESTLATIGALALAGCVAGQSPTLTAEPTASTAAPTDAPSPTSTASASPSPSPSPGEESAFDDPRECENEELGYEVEYPGDWWANERVEADDPVADVDACTYFAPDAVSIEPGTDDLAGIAIRFELREGQTGTHGEILSRDEITVDGHDAVVWEIEPSQTGFIPEGSRLYQYVVELDDGESLVATADNIQVDDETYEEAKQVLDGMMETIDIDD